jgi:hypothetical protein
MIFDREKRFKSIFFSVRLKVISEKKRQGLYRFIGEFVIAIEKKSAYKVLDLTGAA